MQKTHYSPDINRMSVLTVTVLLAFALTHLLSKALYQLAFQIFGRVIRFEFDLRVMVIILAAGLTAAGMDWLLRSHPMMKDKKPAIAHLFVPVLTTLVLGTPLYALFSTSLWWAGFGVAGVFLVLVFWAEYVAVSPGDTSYPVAMVTLTVISFALYLILLLVLRYAEVRLFLLSPALFIATFFVSLRTLHLRLGKRWDVGLALGIALIGVQLAAGLHYLPFSPVQYGIFLLSPMYALIALAGSLIEGMPLRGALLEPGLMLAVILGAGLWLG